MKILVVHEVSYRKKVVYEYQDFAERLASMGHTVNVIDYDADGDFEYKSFRCSKTGLAEVTVENTPYLNLPFVKYASGRLNYLKLLEQKLERKEVDVVFLYSIFINGTNTIRLCRKYGVPVVYRVLDVYHKIRQNPLMAVPLYFGERFTYKNADTISVTNEKMIPYVTKMAGGRTKNITVLHHGVDTDFFKPMPRDPEFAKKHGILPEDKVALFLGTTYSFSGLDAVIERFQRLRERCPNAKIVVVGGGEQEARLKQLVETQGLSGSVILTGFRPYDEVPRWISLADLTFNSFYINDITRDIIPIKMLQYMACGKPVVCAPIPDVMRLFPSGESGMIYQSIEDADAFVDLLGNTLRDDVELQKLGTNALSFITRNFAMTQQISRLESQLKEAVAQGTRS